MSKSIMITLSLEQAAFLAAELSESIERTSMLARIAESIGGPPSRSSFDQVKSKIEPIYEALIRALKR